MTETQNSILRMSDEKTMELIELYEREECLWNTRSRGYKNREKRARAAERIAAAFRVKNFEARHVVIKFKNLRNSYCQELKKIAHSLNAGLGDEEVYRPRVFWFSKMDSFLRPHLQPARGAGSAVQCLTHDVQIKREIEDSEEVEEWLQITNPEVVLTDPVEMPENSSDNDEEAKPLRKRKRKTNGRSQRLEETIESNTLSQTLREITTQLHVMAAQKEDYFESFGRYVASLLRTMPAQKALGLQPKIIGLIASAGIGSCDVGQVSQSDEMAADTPTP